MRAYNDALWPAHCPLCDVLWSALWGVTTGRI